MSSGLTALLEEVFSEPGMPELLSSTVQPKAAIATPRPQGTRNVHEIIPYITSMWVWFGQGQRLIFSIP